MNHNYAIENNTAERYVLGELTEPEREDYEEHFFDCPQCAEEVKCATEFVQGARQVFARDQREAVSAVVARAATGTHWFSAFLRPAVGLACVLALAGFTGFQSLVTVPRLKQRASS